MLLGLTAGVTSEHIGRPEAAGNVARSIKEAATSPAFFRALFASPLIYAGVYAVAQRQPDTVISLIFAFENGFFCQTVRQARKAESAKTSTP